MAVLLYTASLLGCWVWCAVDLLLHTTSLLGSSGQWNSCGTLPHYLGGVNSGTPAVHYCTALGQRAVGSLRYAAALPRGSGQWNTAVQCRTVGEQWAVGLLWYIGSLLGVVWCVVVCCAEGIVTIWQ